jgi:hypothetical protein
MNRFLEHVGRARMIQSMFGTSAPSVRTTTHIALSCERCHIDGYALQLTSTGILPRLKLSRTATRSFSGVLPSRQAAATPAARKSSVSSRVWAMFTQKMSVDFLPTDKSRVSKLKSYLLQGTVIILTRMCFFKPNFHDGLPYLRTIDYIRKAIQHKILVGSVHGDSI